MSKKQLWIQHRESQGSKLTEGWCFSRTTIWICLGIKILVLGETLERDAGAIYGSSVASQKLMLLCLQVSLMRMHRCPWYILFLFNDLEYSPEHYFHTQQIIKQKAFHSIIRDKGENVNSVPWMPSLTRPGSSPQGISVIRGRARCFWCIEKGQDVVKYI